jgi:uncharacterized membrane-anchored protein
MKCFFFRWLAHSLCTAAVFAGLLAPGFAQQKTVEDQITALHWIKSGTIGFSASSSRVSLPPGFIGINGQDARTYEEITQGHPDNDTEAVLLDKDDNEVVFEYFPSGFITIDDWQDLDPKGLIREISDNTEAANAKRREKGVPELHVIGWVQEPSFDRTTKTVFWAINAKSSDGTSVVNSVALRLGRSGYEKVIWITDLANFKPSGGVLDTMLRAHSFDPGQRYDDHVEGDKLAGYGIAALVGAVAGAKLVKIGAFAAILLFAKKLWFLAFAAVAVFFRRIKSLFQPRINPQFPPSDAPG